MLTNSIMRQIQWAKASKTKMFTVNLNTKVQRHTTLHNTGLYIIITNSYSNSAEMLFISFKLQVWNIFLNAYGLITTTLRITNVKSLPLKIFIFCRLVCFLQPFIIIIVSYL